MTELLTAAQMRAIEAAAIESGDATGLELMERAGQGVVDAIFAEWPELAVSPAAGRVRGPAPSADASPPEYFWQNDGETLRAAVLCGPGNNGGDGFVVARLLKEAGWVVDVFFYGDAGRLPPDAKTNYERWVATEAVDLLSAFDPCRHNYALAVDALFGTGLARPIDMDVLRFIRPFSAVDRRVAVDIASGLCADSGRAISSVSKSSDQTYLEARLCVTFHARKLGHLLGHGSQAHQKTVVCDIGMSRRDGLRTLGALPLKDGTPTDECSIAVRTACCGENAATFRDGTYVLDKLQGHKYAYGHAFVSAGGVGSGGAARLAARGALRIGAGAVTIGVPPAALIENAAQLNAVMLQKTYDAADFADVLDDTRINAICVGPGFGTSSREVEMVATAVTLERALVLDADALTILARNPDLFVQLHSKCVLTPHAGEFARLFPDVAEKLDTPATVGPVYSKVDATREAAALAGCVVLFKGADTVIAAPDGQCVVHASVYERSAPWLATAGSGDVLAGFITGLLARGFDPMEAAEMGAWLHTECALAFGPGLIAEDLPEVLPDVLSVLFREAG